MADQRGRRVLVTGAGSGVGRAVALRLAADGARVGVLDVAGDRAAQVTAEAGGGARALTADLRDEAQVAAAVAEFAGPAAGGDDAGEAGLDALVTCAGVQLFGRDAACADLPADVWDATFDVNIRGAFLAVKHALPALIAARGTWIAIGSPTGSYGVAPGFTAYSASKAATLGLVRVVAADYAAAGVRANLVVPGFTRTPLVADLFVDEAALATELARIPLGRPGEPEEIGGLVSYLASAEASFATGAVFTMDGGATAV